MGAQGSSRETEDSGEEEQERWWRELSVSEMKHFLKKE